MLAAITVDGFDNEEYGKTFWTTIDAANAIDGTVNTSVTIKIDLKGRLRKYLYHCYYFHKLTIRIPMQVFIEIEAGRNDVGCTQ